MTANRKSTLQSEPVVFRAIGYCRLSKEHGALGVSDSIANQRKLIRAYVEKQPDMELVGEFFDDGYTGTNYDRPGFRSVLEAVERGRADAGCRNGSGQHKQRNTRNRRQIHIGGYDDKCADGDDGNAPANDRQRHVFLVFLVLFHQTHHVFLGVLLIIGRRDPCPRKKFIDGNLQGIA